MMGDSDKCPLFVFADKKFLESPLESDFIGQYFYKKNICSVQFNLFLVYCIYFGE